MTWDEAKHKRFKGRFASMGLNMQSLRDKHKVRVHDGGAVYHHSGGAPQYIGHIKPRPGGGYAAVSNVEGGRGGDRVVSSRPFQNKAEAAAAIGMEHPSVKTLSMKDDAQMDKVKETMDRIQAKPWTPGTQVEYERARKLYNKLRKERSGDRRHGV